MRTTRGKRNVSISDTRRFTKLVAPLYRCLDNCSAARKRLADLRRSRLKGPRQPALPDAQCIAADPPTAAAHALRNELPALPNERSEALAALCDRLLQDLAGADVKAAEIRFVVHKPDHPVHPSIDPESDPACGELAWDLRRLVASAGDAIADVVRALDLRAEDLDEHEREILQDEATTLDVDLGLLKAQLADATDWDAELQCLLAGEIAPFDDPYADDEDDNDD